MDGTRTLLHADYFPQVLRSDAFTLGINGIYNGRKFNPLSPRNPVVATVLDGNNNSATHQQSSVGSEGWTSYNMAPNVPHTVRARETQDCTTCHLSKAKDNNAWLAQVFGEGTNGYSYMGDYAWVGEPGLLKGIRVSYGYEPQPVIGSNMQRIIDPAKFNEFVKSGRRYDKVRYATPGAAGKTYGSAELVGATHPNAMIARGEWIFVADGPGGFKVYDSANIDSKRTSQKVLLAPFALGNQVVVHTKNATGMDMPGTGPMDLNRPQLDLNHEQVRWQGFRYAFVSDSQEGLIVVDINTFFDRDIQNNYIKRAVTFTPGGALTGALSIKIAGNYAYIACGHGGLKVVDISDPVHPKLAGSVGAPYLTDTRAVQVQFRYAFVADGTGGMKVLDLSDMANPKPVEGSIARIPEARSLYLMKSFAYVAAGKNGLAIVDIEHPEKLGEPKFFSANGQINDTNAVVVCATYASYFAYLADGVNGMHVVRLVEADQTPNHLGWSPEPVPMLIGTYKTDHEKDHPVMCVGEGHRRDRVTDEAGHQLASASRIGSRVMNWDDMKKLLYDSRGNLITVTDSRPKKARGDWGNLPVPPAAWTPDPSPYTKVDDKIQGMR
jgi:hypothetical protein